MYSKTKIITTRYWSDCNMNCSFCFEKNVEFVKTFDKFKLPSKESMILHNEILKNITQYIPNENNTRTILKFMGGELFHRADMKELYEGFDDTVKTLNFLWKKYPNIDSKNTVIFTNLMYKNTELLQYFINKLIENNIYPELSVSFDLSGRFKNNKQVLLLYNNLVNLLEYYNNKISIKINTTLTQDNILALIYEPEELENNIYYFKKMYNEHIDIMLATSNISIEEGLSFNKYSINECEKFVDVLEKKYPKLIEQFFSEDYERSLKYEYYSIQNNTVFNDTINFTGKEVKSPCIMCEHFDICNHLQKFVPYIDSINDCISNMILKRFKRT